MDFPFLNPIIYFILNRKCTPPISSVDLKYSYAKYLEYQDDKRKEKKRKLSRGNQVDRSPYLRD